MIEPLFETIRYGIAVVLIAVLRGARHTDPGRPRPALFVWMGGIVLGVVFAVVYVRFDVRTPVEGIVMLATGVLLGTQLVPSVVIGTRTPGSAWRAAAFLVTAQRTAAISSFAFSKAPDSVQVLNSELLLFYGGIVLGACLLATAGMTLSPLRARSGSVQQFLATTAIVLLMGEQVSWGYYALVLHGWFVLPESLFTPVTFLINHIQWFGHSQLALTVTFGLWCFLRRENPREAQMACLGPAGRRKYLWGIRRQSTYGVVFLTAVSAIVGVAFYYRLYANQPMRLTPAERLEANGGRLVIPIQQFEPEEFHRYAYADDEGHDIRFVVFKDEGGRIKAAYDACILCGTKGYLKQGKELICLACGAAIYAQTVGRSGGCNPIPLAYSIAGGTLVVSVDTLLHGDGAESFRDGHGGHQ